jgi:hypothetical protein
VADAGGFGPFRAGHSHSDTLSIVFRRGGQDILIDPGTHSYAEPQWRNWFRGSAAHNTVRVDQSDQARPLGSFGWAGKPVTKIRQWESSDSRDYLDATCQYDGQPFTHRRRLLFEKHRGWLLILDQVDGSVGDRHLAEQFWNIGCPVVELGPHAFQLGNPAAMRLLLDETMECALDRGWHSPAYGVKLPGHSIVARRRAAFPVMFAAALVDPSCEVRAVKLQKDGSQFSIVVGDCTVCFPDSLAFAGGKAKLRKVMQTS